MDFGQVNLKIEHFIHDIFKDSSSTGIYKSPRHLFGTAITPVGHLDYADSILSQVNKVYHLKGNIGTGKTTFLRNICDKAIQKGMNVEIFHYPLIKDKIETVIIKDLDIGITVSSLFEGKNTINLNAYLDEEKLEKYIEEIKFDKKVFDELLNYAISNLKKAKAKHDIMKHTMCLI